MHTFIVTIFNMSSPSEQKEVTVQAGNQDVAERYAIGGGLVNLASGWGVLGSMQTDREYSVDELADDVQRVFNLMQKHSGPYKVAVAEGRIEEGIDLTFTRMLSEPAVAVCKEEDNDKETLYIPQSGLSSMSRQAPPAVAEMLRTFLLQ